MIAYFLMSIISFITIELILLFMCVRQGSRHEVLFEGGGEDGFIGTQTHLTPKFSFFSDFGHFILKMVENAKFPYVSKRYINISFSGGRPPLIFQLRGTRPPRPPAFDAHGVRVSRKPLF